MSCWLMLAPLARTPFERALTRGALLLMASCALFVLLGTVILSTRTVYHRMRDIRGGEGR